MSLWHAHKSYPRGLIIRSFGNPDPATNLDHPAAFSTHWSGFLGQGAY